MKNAGTIILQKPSIVKIGYFKAQNSLARTMHYHPNTELVLIKKGTAHIELNGKNYYAQERSLLIYPQMQPHFDEFINKSSYIENYFLRITDFQMPNVYENSMSHPDYSPVIETEKWFDALNLYFQTIYNECTHRNAGCSSVSSHALTCIVMILKRLCKRIQSTPVSASQMLCRDVIEYICSNYSKDISIQSIAEVLKISSSYLYHTLKREMGISPFQYITYVRIQKARQYLLLTDYAPKTISHYVGYRRYSAFYQHFVAQTQMSPEEYREENDLICQKDPNDHILLA